MSHAHARVLRLAVAAALSVGCQGVIGDAHETGDRAGPTPRGGEVPGDDGPIALDVATTPLQRLTRRQYVSTVRDLLGVELDPELLPGDERVGAFHANVEAPVDLVAVERYLRAAETAAASADIAALLPCDPASGDAGCASRFIADFVYRAWRRPLTADEQTTFEALHALGTDGGAEFARGMRLVIDAALASPETYYRIEASTPTEHAGIERLDAHSLVSRLSYYLWQSTPDDELLALANDGSIHDVGVLRAQAERMLDDPRAGEAIRSFASQWLGIEELAHLQKDATLFPEFDDALAREMGLETEQFVDHVVREGDGRLETLLTGSFSFGSDRVLALYGAEAPPRAGEPAALDPARRAGVLTHASVLATHASHDQTSPIHRGLFVRQRLLCQDLPPPPDGLMVSLPPLDDAATTRERFAQHRADPACSGCHELMDPIGFGFEAYDAIGRYRETENGLPVDASGRIVGSEDLDGAFVGAVELANRLVESEQVQRCLAEQWLRFGLGRATTDADRGSVVALTRELDASDRDVRRLLVELVTTFSFLHRRVVAEEGG